jgi:hypothetical protein
MMAETIKKLSEIYLKGDLAVMLRKIIVGELFEQ